jgi:hypothetical protein
MQYHLRSVEAHCQDGAGRVLHSLLPITAMNTMIRDDIDQLTF